MNQTQSIKNYSTYFQLNDWSYPLYDTAITEFQSRRAWKRPPQTVLITDSKDVRLPDTSLDVFRIDVPEAFTPELYAWPVHGVPTAIVITSNLQCRLKDLCLEYRCPLVECYQLERNELYGPTIYSELGAIT